MIIALDTDAQDMYASEDREAIEKFLSIQTTIADRKKEELKFEYHWLTRGEFRFKQVNKYIDELIADTLVDREESVLMYVHSSHGELDSLSQLMLEFKDTTINSDVLVKKIHNSGFRLSIAILNACHSPNLMADVALPKRQKRKDKKVKSKWKTPSSKHASLFERSQGYITAYSASPGEDAWSTPDKGGIFIHQFFEALQRELKNDAPNWDRLLEAACSKTTKEVEALQKHHPSMTEQTPYYTGELNGKTLEGSVPELTINKADEAIQDVAFMKAAGKDLILENDRYVSSAKDLTADQWEIHKQAWLELYTASSQKNNHIWDEVWAILRPNTAISPVSAGKYMDHWQLNRSTLYSVIVETDITALPGIHFAAKKANRIMYYDVKKTIAHYKPGKFPADTTIHLRYEIVFPYEFKKNKANKLGLFKINRITLAQSSLFRESEKAELGFVDIDTTNLSLGQNRGQSAEYRHAEDKINAVGRTEVERFTTSIRDILYAGESQNIKDQEALSLTLDLFEPDATIEVSSINRPGARAYSMNSYQEHLKDLISHNRKLRKYDRVEYSIGHVFQVNDLKLVSRSQDGTATWKGKIRYSQIFRGFRNGVERYADKTEKDVEVIWITNMDKIEEADPKIRLGDITVISTVALRPKVKNRK